MPHVAAGEAFGSIQEHLVKTVKSTMPHGTSAHAMEGFGTDCSNQFGLYTERFELKYCPRGTIEDWRIILSNNTWAAVEACDRAKEARCKQDKETLRDSFIQEASHNLDEFYKRGKVPHVAAKNAFESIQEHLVKTLKSSMPHGTSAHAMEGFGTDCSNQFGLYTERFELKYCPRGTIEDWRIILSNNTWAAVEACDRAKEARCKQDTEDHGKQDKEEHREQDSKDRGRSQS